MIERRGKRPRVDEVWLHAVNHIATLVCNPCHCSESEHVEIVGCGMIMIPASSRE
jgi:hypothetical protein